MTPSTVSSETSRVEASPLRSYLQVLRRRWFVAIQPIVIVPLFALLLTHSQPAKYQASAEVLLNRTDIAAALTNIQDPNAGQAPERLAATQAELARVPTIARRALESVGLKSDPGYLLAESSVDAHPDADLLDFKVTDRSAPLAQRLATAYARAFTKYQRELEKQSIQGAIHDITTHLEALDAAGLQHSGTYADLLQRRTQLITLQALQTPSSTVVSDAGAAVQVAPRPFRNAVLALAVGLILGIGLAFLYDMMDVRVWTSSEAAALLGLPLLGRIPRVKGRTLVMATDPDSPAAEAFRRLRTNIVFTREGKRTKTILITSALPEEGKSMTAANLAIALAREGHHVVAVDLDLRSPTLDRYFSLNGQPGLTDVVLGRVDLRQAIVTAGNPGSNGVEAASLEAVRERGRTGTLRVVPAGQVPQHPGEFVTAPAVESILSELAQTADFVLIDSSPTLAAGDAAVISRYVDAVIVVLRLDGLRPRTVEELRHSLDSFGCEKLGLVVTGAEETGRYGGYPSQRHRRPAAQDASPESVRQLKRV